MNELEQALGASVEKAKIERRHAASPSMADYGNRSRSMADEIPGTARVYHHLGHVCLDKDPTVLVMVVPFKRANKGRS